MHPFLLLVSMCWKQREHTFCFFEVRLFVALLLHSPLILWSHMKHSGGGRLHCVLLCGSIVTGSSLEVLLEEASPAFFAGCLFTQSLSNGYKSFICIPWRHVRTDHRLAWSHYESQIFHMAWHYVGHYVLCTGNPGHMSHFIFCGTLSMWGLYPYSVTQFEDSLLLIVCRCWCSIDSFQPYAVPIDHIGWCCSRGHVILWCDVVPVYCFRYSTPFSGSNPFYSSVTLLRGCMHSGIEVRFSTHLGRF